MGPALAPTPELLEKVAALPPAADEPDVDIAAQTKLETPFRFSRFLRPFRWPLVAGLAPRDARRRSRPSPGRG